MLLVNKKGTWIIITTVGVFKKRLFRRNQYVNLKTQRNTAEQGKNRTEIRVNISTSASKFHNSWRENTNKFGESVNMNVKADNITDMRSCFMLLDIDVLKSVINLIGSCPKFQKRSVEIISNPPAQKKGLSLHLNLMCMKDDCDWNTFFYISKEGKSYNPGASPFEINDRAIIAMRKTEKGFTGLSNFCGFMNLPPPMKVKAFNDMQKKIASTSTYVADGSMKTAVNEFIPAQGQGNENIVDDIPDITVSNDGSWQKSGHSSLNGVVKCNKPVTLASV